MRLMITDIKLQYNEHQKAEVLLTTDSRMVDISREKDIVSRGKQLIADIKQYRRPRSLDANGYMWQLCQKIAEVIRSTKEEVYKKAVQEVGQFEIVPIRDDAVERWVHNWEGKGLGWHAEIIGASKIEGYTNTMNYFGSSVYDTREMAILIDYIVDEAKNADIEVLPPHEVQRLKEEWGNDVPKAKAEKATPGKEQSNAHRRRQMYRS